MKNQTVAIDGFKESEAAEEALKNTLRPRQHENRQSAADEQLRIQKSRQGKIENKI